MLIAIERERNTPTPGKNARYRARIYKSRQSTHDSEPAVFISAANFGSVTGAKDAMEFFFGHLEWWPEAEGDRRTFAEKSNW